MITKVLHWPTALGALCSAVAFLWADLPWLAGIEAACAIGLVIGFFWKSVRVTRFSQLLLLLQAVVLGGIWPSGVTIAALLVLPGLVLVVLDTFRKPMMRGWQVYLYSSAVTAAWSLAAEGWLLATIPRG